MRMMKRTTRNALFLSHQSATRRASKADEVEVEADVALGRLEDEIELNNWTVASDAPAIAAAVRLRPSRGYSSRRLSYRAQSVEGILWRGRESARAREKEK